MYRARIHYHKLQRFYARARHQGYGRFSVFAQRLPLAVLGKLYKGFAVFANGQIVNKLINLPRFKKFYDSNTDNTENIFYLIVMPNTLHFLNPCLKLIHRKVNICLLFNGAKQWERDFIKAHFPGLPWQRLIALPGSSVSHGDVLNLLLQTNKNNFGVIDHDTYVFNDSVFEDLSFAENEFLIAYFYGQSKKAKMYYPLTHFLFFNTKIVLDIMQRNNVDCRLYRKPPKRIFQKLTEAGIKPNVPLKDYHSFFDTLHLLYVVACAEGWCATILDVDDKYAILHVGGTSWSGHSTKELIQVYTDLRFLELTCNRDLIKMYKKKITKCQSSQELREILLRTRDVIPLLLDVDMVISRLKMHPAVSS
jgi:hypothetical protein